MIFFGLAVALHFACLALRFDELAAVLPPGVSAGLLWAIFPLLLLEGWVDAKIPEAERGRAAKAAYTLAAQGVGHRDPGPLLPHHERGPRLPLLAREQVGLRPGPPQGGGARGPPAGAGLGLGPMIWAAIHGKLSVEPEKSEVDSAA